MSSYSHRRGREVENKVEQEVVGTRCGDWVEVKMWSSITYKEGEIAQCLYSIERDHGRIESFAVVGSIGSPVVVVTRVPNVSLPTITKVEVTGYNRDGEPFTVQP